jgi:hypothetical protein
MDVYSYLTTIREGYDFLIARLEREARPDAVDPDLGLLSPRDQGKILKDMERDGIPGPEWYRLKYGHLFVERSPLR